MQNKLQTHFDKYIDQCKYTDRLRPATLKGYTEVFHHFSVLMSDIKTPDMLTYTVMNEFFKKLQVRKRIVGKGIVKIGVKDSTIHTYWSKLKSFFDWMVEHDLLIKNPLPKKSKFQPVYEDAPAFKKEEVEKMYSSIAIQTKTPLMLMRDRAMISLLLFTGARKTEFISLQGRDIDLQKDVLTIRAETSKSKKTRQIPIHPTLKNHLQDYLAERKKGKYTVSELFVSSERDHKLTSHGLKHWVSKLIKLTGIKFHLHQFRHTFACNLSKNNASEVIIMKLLGHTDLRMTQRYLRSLGVDDLKDDILKLSIDNMF